MLAQLLPPHSPALTSTPQLRPLQLLLLSDFVCFSVLSLILSGSCQLLIPDASTSAMQLLLPNSVRFCCCSLITSAAYFPRLCLHSILTSPAPKQPTSATQRQTPKINALVKYIYFVIVWVRNNYTYHSGHCAYPHQIVLTLTELCLHTICGSLLWLYHLVLQFADFPRTKVIFAYTQLDLACVVLECG